MRTAELAVQHLLSVSRSQAAKLHRPWTVSVHVLPRDARDKGLLLRQAHLSPGPLRHLATHRAHAVQALKQAGCTEVVLAISYRAEVRPSTPPASLPSSQHAECSLIV